MEHSLTISDIEDAKDLFLLAKDRLLDVNDWNSLFPEKGYHIQLTNSKGEKLHRDARVDDLISIKAANNNGNTSEMCVRIGKIQYDFYPDVRSESISMLLEMAYSPSGDGIEHADKKVETLLIKREYGKLTAYCNSGNELPGPDDESPSKPVNADTDLHPVLCIPTNQLQQMLAGLIAMTEYAEA